MNNSSTSTDVYARFGSNSYIVYDSKFLDLDVKFADVNGTNLFHVKSFVESYNKVNKEPIVEFKEFIVYRTDNNSAINEYLQYAAEFYNDSRASTALDLLDSNNRWNIPNVIVYCYSQLDNTRGYWVCGEVLSRYAQRGNQRFAFMVDHLIASIATFNEQKMSEALQSLTLDNEKLIKRTETFKKECSQACCYMKPEVGKDYVAYVEWISSKNELFIGSMDKKKYMKERAKKNEQGKPSRYFIYAKDNKFGIQLRDLYRDCLIDVLGDNIRVNKCHLIFKNKVNINGIQWKVRNCMQRIRVEATTPEV